ncbi:MAG: hypothetical protein CBB72_002785 [Muricauda sp. TMED12]|nr:MAG: hypothetical protein CBB72_002785 [Muricauda sp. TMED12]
MQTRKEGLPRETVLEFPAQRACAEGQFYKQEKVAIDLVFLYPSPWGVARRTSTLWCSSSCDLLGTLKTSSVTVSSSSIAVSDLTSYFS